MLLFSFREQASAVERDRMLRDLAQFPAQFSQIKNLEIGVNASDRDATYDVGMTMTFDSLADMHAYLKSDAHEQFVRDRFRPLISRRAIVSFEVP